MPNFTVTTLGCKVNQYESDAIAQSLKNAGCTLLPGKTNADVCIINTCTVTHKASMQSRQAVRQAIRNNPGAHVIVTGCYAQIEPDAIRKIKGVHAIVGHADKHRIPETIICAFQADQKDRPQTVSVCRDIALECDFQQMPVAASGSRTRIFLKIQDGCNTFCSYCIVPYARGRSRSLPLENVLEYVHTIQQAGCREVVLTGVHLGAYGLDLSPKRDLFTLLNRIQEFSTINRVRLSSIEPFELTHDIIRLVAESQRLCHHFHIPLQSGDDLVLKKMNRPYTRSFFRDLVLKIHELIPDAAIGVDILVGFPGETEAAFKNTYSLIQELPVTYLHVFPFSSRAGTPASRYSHKVSSGIIKTRCEQMRVLGSVKKSGFYKKFIGQKVEVLFESKRDSSTGYLKGLTSNYIPALANAKDDLKNTLVQVKIDKLFNNNSVIGSICK
ncbi:MAG: tRNA (N(6)-L-threonylcarbamoyladenosine(37)-C(2))-methylthiotransferase MtaB [Pseudomonadota bacterium]